MVGRSLKEEKVNYEVEPVRIPANRHESEALEAWLERVAQGGGRLISVAPSQSPGTMLCIFTVLAPGDIDQSKPPTSSANPVLDRISKRRKKRRVS